jgi:hypothetical protein
MGTGAGERTFLVGSLEVSHLDGWMKGVLRRKYHKAREGEERACGWAQSLFFPVCSMTFRSSKKNIQPLALSVPLRTHVAAPGGATSEYTSPGSEYIVIM